MSVRPSAVAVATLALLLATVAAPAATLAEQLAAAEPGGLIELPAGEHTGGVAITRPVTIRGADRETCLVTGAPIALRIEADVTLEGLTIRGEATGVYLAAGHTLRVIDCVIRDAQEDGIGFDDSTASAIEIRDCLVTGNGDGVDLEGTRGLIVTTSFEANRDDGLDYDGDADVTCIGCGFTDNGDDGVEIRIARRTQAIFTDCTFERNGEDGLEIINTERDETDNCLILGNNRFADNTRFGVGFVHAKEEKAKADDRSRCLVLWGRNEFRDNGAGDVSENHRLEMTRAQVTAEAITLEVTRGGTTETVTLPLLLPSPVGTIPMQPSINGVRAGDLEGVAVDERYIYLADDDFPAIHLVDRRTSQVVRSMPTNPVAFTNVIADGPEGLSVVEQDGGKELYLSADDGDGLFRFARDLLGPGAILGQESTAEFAHYPEDVEVVGDVIYLAHGNRNVTAVDAARKTLPGFPVQYTPAGYGQHLAGVGYDGRRLLVTLAAYGGKRAYNPHSLLLALDPTDGTPLAVWQLPYSIDPRGIAVADGVAYVADGMSPFDDADTGAKASPGIRVLLFALDDLFELPLTALPGRQLPT